MLHLITMYSIIYATFDNGIHLFMLHFVTVFVIFATFVNGIDLCYISSSCLIFLLHRAGYCTIINDIAR